MNHRIRQRTGLKCLGIASATTLVLFSMSGVSQAQSGLQMAAAEITVNYDPASHAVSVSPTTLTVNSGMSTTVAWVPADGTFSVTNVRFCGSNGFPVSAGASGFSGTDINDSPSTQGDMPYQVTVDAGGKSYSSAACGGRDVPVIHNG